MGDQSSLRFKWPTAILGENFHLPTVAGAASVTGSLCVQRHLNTQLQEDFLQRYLGRLDSRRRAPRGLRKVSDCFE